LKHQLCELDQKLLQLVAIYPEGIDRDELHRRTGVPRTTLFDHLVKLLQCELVVTQKRKNGSQQRGRPRTLWRSNQHVRRKESPNTHVRTTR
jgi:predicted ArsR family transcriptional regulator